MLADSVLHQVAPVTLAGSWGPCNSWIDTIPLLHPHKQHDQSLRQHLVKLVLYTPDAVLFAEVCGWFNHVVSVSWPAARAAGSNSLSSAGNGLPGSCYS